MNAMFEQGKLTLMYVSDWVIELTKTDRIARAAGEKAATIPVVAKDSSTPSALPTADSYKFFSEWEAKSAWKNEVTVRRYSNPPSPVRLSKYLTLHQCRTPPRKRPFTHGAPHLTHPIAHGRVVKTTKGDQSTHP